MRFRNRSLLFLILFLAAGFTGLCRKNDYDEKFQTDAAYALIKRVIPSHAKYFKVGLIKKANEHDCFEIESVGGRIILRGNNGVAIASALNYYLKNIAHCSITWNGTNLKLPFPLPAVKQKLRQETPLKYRYYLNYCTFNYTMSWWNWDRWQKEIDWMAMNGINMPLALTGQNAIWSRVYRSMGIKQSELGNFFSGPAYFSWFWMGNLDGWGGPLPQSWMDAHEALQKKILKAERALGMTPVLPAFTGHIPAALKEKYPNAVVRKTSWNGKFADVYLLDPSDPLFVSIGKKFIEEQTKAYGTDHLYSADTFNENTPPTNDSAFLSEVSKNVYQSMATADPKAVWVMQGWLFHFSAKFWQPAQIKAALNAVPDDKMILLDLWSERHPVWNRTEAYYGKPWIWCMLHNFGGNISLYGTMANVASGPSEVLHDPAAGKISGIGLTMEGIEQNPVMYELMLENVWATQPIQIDSWLEGYAWRRYGKKNEAADKAWAVLKETVYKDTLTSGGSESIICGRPTFAAGTRGVNTRLAYKAEQLLPAWKYMVAASTELKGSDGFQYDLVDLTRQVLANYANVLQQECAALYKRGNIDSFKIQSRSFLTLIADMDQLLATRKDFLLGTWLADARRWGTTPQERDLYEKNARDLITLWGDKNSTLREYACRQWSGLLNGYYKNRWKQFFSYVDQQMQSREPVDEKYFDSRIKEWEWSWVNSHETYPVKPQGDAVAVALSLFKKYLPIVEAAYQK